MEITFDLPEWQVQFLEELSPAQRNLYTENLWIMALYTLGQRQDDQRDDSDNGEEWAKRRGWRPFTPHNVLPRLPVSLIGSLLEEPLLTSEADPMPGTNAGTRCTLCHTDQPAPIWVELPDWMGQQEHWFCCAACRNDWLSGARIFPTPPPAQTDRDQPLPQHLAQNPLDTP